MKAIKNVKLVTTTGILEHKAVVFDSGIRGILDETEVDPGISVIDGEGFYLAPGFIDLHTHGCAGYDVMDDDPQALVEISKNLVRTGVTAYLPTTMTMEFTRVTQALERVRQQKKQPAGAQILGCHLEGPFLSRDYAGAQDPAHLLDPCFTRIQPFADLIRIVTMAPEKTGGINLIKECRHHNILVSLGHSNASLHEAEAAIFAGASRITHTFNVMSPLHHRTPGVVAAALLHDVTCELIADNVHVHPGVQQLLLKNKGVERIVLITDAMRACLLQEGDYGLGGQFVEVRGNEARLKGGQLAGSVLTMNLAIKNFMENTGIALWEAVRLASFNPAMELGLSNKGRIDTGKDADLVLFDPDFSIIMTFVSGQLVYRRD